MAKHWFTVESDKGESVVFASSKREAERQMRAVRNDRRSMIVDWSDSLDAETRRR